MSNQVSKEESVESIVLHSTGDNKPPVEDKNMGEEAYTADGLMGMTKEYQEFIEPLQEVLFDYLVNLPDGHKKETSWWHYRGYEIPFSVEDFANKDAIASKIIEGIKASGFFEYGLKIIELCKNNK